MSGTIALVDNLFSWSQDCLHANGDRVGHAPSHINWLPLSSVGRYPNEDGAPIWFTGGGIEQAAKRPDVRRVGWLVEPFDLHPEDYALAARELLAGNIETLVTADPDRFVMDGGEDVRTYPHGGTRIHSSDWLVWPKSIETPSIVASPKRSLLGHQMRHHIITHNPQLVHPFGHEYRPITRKLDALAPYMFSVAIENVKRPYWFTEALVDCFLTGTVPIYWGAERLTYWGFDMRGVIECKNAGDVIDAIEHVRKNDYFHRLPYIKHNLMAALQFTCTEDWMWRKWPDLFARVAIPQLESVS